MDGEIILNRNDTNVMKLDDNEQALMDEIEITVPRPQPVKKQMPKRMATQFTPPETQTFQEDIDSFANPDKQTRPSAPPPEEPPPVEGVLGVDIWLWTFSGAEYPIFCVGGSDDIPPDSSIALASLT